VQPHRDWTSFAVTLGRELETLTGAQSIGMHFRDAQGAAAEQLLRDCPPLPAGAPLRPGEGLRDRDVACYLLYSAPDLRAWLVLRDPGRWNLDQVMSAAAEPLGDISARVWRFSRLRRQLASALGGREPAPNTTSGDMAAILLAAAGAIDGAPLYVSLAVAEQPRTWWLSHGEARTAAFSDAEAVQRLREAERAQAVLLRGPAASRLAAEIGVEQPFDWLYLVALSPAVAAQGFVGVGLSAPERSLQLRVIEQLRLVARELEGVLTQWERWRQAYVSGVVQERTLLGMELHDSVLQDLTYVQLQLGRIEQTIRRDPAAAAEILGAVRSLLSTSSKETRELSVGLSASSVSDDLVAVVDALLERFRRRFEGEAELVVNGSPRALSPATNSQVMRMCQELLNNVAKHAAATRVTVELAFEPNRLTMVVADNGRGFVLDQPSPDHLGLYSLRQRADRLNAELDVAGEAGAGTRVTVRIPT
jgi:signal transduction histidine kinase